MKGFNLTKLYNINHVTEQSMQEARKMKEPSMLKLRDLYFFKSRLGYYILGSMRREF